MNNDPLKVTTTTLHRFWFAVATVDQWYSIIHELRATFGRNWAGQAKVKKKLTRNVWHNQFWGREPNTHMIWFDIPDPAIATWIGIKLGIDVVTDDQYMAKQSKNTEQ